jgi:predicted unusual protein kinase regulating ubiquinone biosynthesis (AarF/ABC1/UbiB family)
MAEESRLGRRVRRYAEVGTAVGGLAARLAGARYFGVELDQDRHAADLRAALGGLKGPLMKVAQILSTIPDALPESYAAELGQLQADAPSMGWPFVRRRMAAELGQGWAGKYASFGHQAARAASLGQVHRATGHDGRAFACKLQYPDMRSVVQADLRQLRIVLAIFERYDKAVSTSQIYEEVAARLWEELDYAREARHMALYGHMLAEEPAVHVPEAVPDLSTDRLLTMTWLEGTPLINEKEAPLAHRNRIARNMFHAWYRPLYAYGAIHGDPHLGNYSVRGDGTVNLLDFGCIRIFPTSFVRGVIDLYHALRDGDETLAVHAYETWGFQDIGREVIDVLNIWAEFVYAPLMEDRERRIQETEGGHYGATVAARVHRELRRLGGVTPPREFVLMDRAAIGLGSVFLHLKAELNWSRMFRDLIADFDEAVLAKRQAMALEEFGLTESA